MDYKLILYNVDEQGIARITFNDPQRLNPLSWAMYAEIDNALVAAEKDNQVKVIVLKGAGRCFSTGGDLGAGHRAGDEPKGIRGEAWRGSLWNGRAHTTGQADYAFRIWDLWKPTICQVHGYCLGAATELALVSDIVTVAEDCLWGYPIARYQNTGTIQVLNAWHVGPKKAMEMQMGRVLTGKEASEWGLANYSFPAEQLEEKTDKIAKRLAIMDAELLMLHKTMLHRTFDMMGWRTAAYVGSEYDAFGHARRAMRQIPDWQRWQEYKAKFGVGKAIKMMHEPFGGMKPGPLDENPL
jgi:enoyl-CoA hydratase